MEYGLWYPIGKYFSLTVYTNGDWVGDIDDRQSTSSGDLFLGESLVSWLSKKQDSISLSTNEVEYIATNSCCTKLLWMKQAFQDLQVFYEQTIPIIYDNTSAISMSKNLFVHSKTKNIPIKYHFLREQVAAQIVKLEYVPTKE